MGAALAINLAPGASILYLSPVAANHGVKAGTVASLGLALGVVFVVTGTCINVAAARAARSAGGALHAWTARWIPGGVLLLLGAKLALLETAAGTSTAD